VKIGLHLSISSGFEALRRQAERLHLRAVQIFVKNPRSWAPKRWKEKHIQEFSSLARDFSVFAHISYLPNPARALDEERHLLALMHEIELCVQIGIGYVVLHPGARKEKERGLLNLRGVVREMIQRYEIRILIENTAGAGSELGCRLGELREMLEGVEPSCRVGFCIDTSHLFQAGYDIRKPEVWDEVKSILGRENIGLIHLNDSKTPLGSRIDRHWHIGKGQIGIETFSYILHDPDLKELSFIMEPPEMGKRDEENVRVVNALLSPLELHLLP